MNLAVDAPSGWQRRVWQSPAIMSWGSLAIRLASVLVVWPVALRKFDATEIVLWQVFATVVGLQVVADFGFSPTLARFAAFAQEGPVPGDGDELSFDVATRMRRLRLAADFVYRRLTVAGCVVVALTTVVVWQRLEDATAPVSGIVWLAWTCVALAFLVALRSGGWSALLQGSGHLARVRRAEIATGACGLVATVAGLLTMGGLLSVTVPMLLVSVGQASWCRRALGHGGAPRGTEDFSGRERTLARVVWSNAWRSGLGVLVSTGMAQAATLVVAAVASAAWAAAYMLAWRLISVINQVAQIPFYSLLPEFGALAAAGRKPELLARARVAIAVGLGLFTALHVVLGATGPWLLPLLRAHVDWPSAAIWVTLGLAFFLERYGAMHLQLDTLGHEVRWHFASGGTAVITASVMAILAPTLGPAAVPAGLLTGNLLFYCPYSVALSRRRYGWTWLSFDWPATVALVVMLGVGVFLLL